MTILVPFFTALGGLAKALGFSGCLFAIVALVLLSLAARFVERVDRLADRLQRRWRQLPPWGKQCLAFLALVGLGPSLWRVVPKTAGAVAFVLFVGTVWWVGGLRHAHRYQLEGASPWQAWDHHWSVTRAARKHTAALADGTGKKGGKVHKPTIRPNGQEYIVRPAHQMNDVETADAYNDGRITIPLKDRFGDEVVQDVHAEPVGDGTIRVSVLAAQTKDDFFAESHPWPGLE